MCLEDGWWQWYALNRRRCVDGFVHCFGFQQVDGRAAEDFFGSAEVVKGGLAVVEKVVPDDLVIFLVRRPSNLPLLCSGRFRSFNFTSIRGIFILFYSI